MTAEKKKRQKLRSDIYFVDTSFLAALIHKQDQNHLKSVQWVRDHKRVRYVTTYSVLNELTALLLSRSIPKQDIIRVIQIILDDTDWELIRTDDKIWYEAWDIFKSHTDKQYSMVDCISFVIMKNRRIYIALTYDSHFKQYGFSTFPISMPKAQ